MHSYTPLKFHYTVKMGYKPLTSHFTYIVGQDDSIAEQRWNPLESDVDGGRGDDRDISRSSGHCSEEMTV